MLLRLAEPRSKSAARFGNTPLTLPPSRQALRSAGLRPGAFLWGFHCRAPVAVSTCALDRWQMNFELEPAALVRL
jgi:hypothetical protein